MSWFDAAGFANIAKSALKEAQKTIDRALDIKDEPNTVPINTPVDPNLEDFFGTWGITQSGNAKQQKKDSLSDSFKDEKVGSSIWGSFTGSFFDSSKEIEKLEKLSSTSSLEDAVDGSIEHFSHSKLVVQQSEEDLSPLEIEPVNKVIHFEAPSSEDNLGNIFYVINIFNVFLKIGIHISNIIPFRFIIFFLESISVGILLKQ